MKGFILLALVTICHAKSIEQAPLKSAYGYIKNVAIPLGEEIRKAEEASVDQVPTGRIAGGSFAQLGQFPYQAGVLTNYIGEDGTGVCGASLVSATRLVYAAHCWFDGQLQGFLTTIVLGSTTIFFGGTRIATSDIVMHPEWDFRQIRQDVAVIKLPISVQFSNTIAPIALPAGPELNEDFANEVAVASGFGRTGDGASGAITTLQMLSFVELNVLSNEACRRVYSIPESNVCTSGLGGTSTCQGDSGGPLVVVRNNRPTLIGITSFGVIIGCTVGFPTAFARVTSFMDFFNQNL